jgi:hypothetical protein
MIMAVPFLYATGIYNPPVVHHGRFMAEPGTFNALLLHGTHRSSAELSGTIATRGAPADSDSYTISLAEAHMQTLALLVLIALALILLATALHNG